jgi:hypothetical protein
MAGEGQGASVYHVAEWQPSHPQVGIPALAGVAGGGRLMTDATTYDARVYRTEVYKGAEVTTYKVRWKVGGRLWKEGFRTAAQADSFRSALLTAARKGEAFSLATGRPAAWERRKAGTSWYEFACAYVDMKWKQASAKYRKDIARALTAATPAMLAEAHGRRDDASIRRALVRWGFNTKQRSDPPEDVAEVLAWVALNSAPVSALAEAATARRILVQATGLVDGRNAAASTARRHRTILANAADYAVELGHLGKFGTAPDGRLFGGVRGGELPTITYRRGLDQSAPDGSERRGAGLAARPAPIRPPARLPVHMAQRRRLPDPGS